jgi:hypothetical protein
VDSNYTKVSGQNKSKILNGMTTFILGTGELLDVKHLSRKVVVIKTRKLSWYQRLTV